MIIVIWLLCAVVCVLIAQSKGLSSGAAAVLGLLFGVFAVIGYALAGSKKKAPKLSHEQWLKGVPTRPDVMPLSTLPSQRP